MQVAAAGFGCAWGLAGMGAVGGECQAKGGGAAARGECGARAWGVLRAASVGITLSPSARVVVLLRSDFLAYYC
jgi:hypothetical protein